LNILTISNLYVDFPTDDDLAGGKWCRYLSENEVLGLIGESDCSKSILGLSIMRLLQEDVIFKGDILYRGKNLYSIEKERHRLNILSQISSE